MVVIGDETICEHRKEQFNDNGQRVTDICMIFFIEHKNIPGQKRS